MSMVEKGVELQRVKSGIPGLDALMSGGFVKGNSTLICGAPGTGKTLVGLQFLYRGAKDYGEPGLYVCIEEDPHKLIAYAKSFGWDLDDLIRRKMFDFVSIPIDYHGFNIMEAIEEKARRIKAQRMVVDSLSALNFNASMFDLPLENQPDPT